MTTTAITASAGADVMFVDGSTITFTLRPVRRFGVCYKGSRMMRQDIRTARLLAWRKEHSDLGGCG